MLAQDEVDSLGQSRVSSTDAGARRLLTELLIQFTRAAGEEGLYVFGATNRMQVWRHVWAHSQGLSNPASDCAEAARSRAVCLQQAVQQVMVLGKLQLVISSAMTPSCMMIVFAAVP
jgi:hypothetical protein